MISLSKATELIYHELNSDRYLIFYCTHEAENHTNTDSIRMDAISLAAAMALTAIADMHLLIGKAILCSAIAIARKGSGFTLEAQAWRLVEALTLLALAGVSSACIPLAFLKPMMVFEICNTLRQQAYHQPLATLEDSEVVMLMSPNSTIPTPTPSHKADRRLTAIAAVAVAAMTLSLGYDIVRWWQKGNVEPPRRLTNATQLCTGKLQGFQYIGECQDGVPHGQGISYQDRDDMCVIMYQGSVKQGQRDGLGCSYWNDGTIRYEGMFEYGLDSWIRYQMPDKHMIRRQEEGKNW